ncbi:hypothetical protein T484DRAFT_3499286 [Baffinella frigidus]|nr:hypothetical protein T484DRAFT_3499286 [Cryptophyta sp. CCMP2293]
MSSVPCHVRASQTIVNFDFTNHERDSCCCQASVSLGTKNRSPLSHGEDSRTTDLSSNVNLSRKQSTLRIFTANLVTLPLNLAEPKPS